MFLHTNPQICALFGAALSLGLAAAQTAHADELLTNGGFETGNLNGWTVLNSPPAIRPEPFPSLPTPSTPTSLPTDPPRPLPNWLPSARNPAPFTPFPTAWGRERICCFKTLWFPSTPGSSASGSTCSSATGTARERSTSPAADHAQVDAQLNLLPTQFARVDLLTAGANVFSIAPADIVKAMYAGVDSGTPANDYIHYSFDVTNLVQRGSSYQLRFAEVDNQFTINQGVDNVSVTSDTPEPGTFGLFLGMGLTGASLLRRRRSRAARR